MESIISFFQHLTDAQWLMDNGGLYVVVLIIFAETGLFIGFFLPGDYLLFIAGMVVAAAPEPFATPLLNLLYWCALLSSAAIIGNSVGYWFGKRSGPYLFERKDTWLFKKKHIYQAKHFYEKRGGIAIIIARFLPVVRTFAPIVAGVVKMEFKKFLLYNIAGAILWVFGLVSLGFVLGKNAWVKEHLEYIVIAIIVLTTTPVLFKMIWGKFHHPHHPPHEEEKQPEHEMHP